MDKVWHARVVIEDALTRFISQLRLTFSDSKTRQIIHTVPKKGYRLSADVTWLTRQEFIKLSTKHHTPSVWAWLFNKRKVVTVIMLSLILALLVYVLSPQTSVYLESVSGALNRDIENNLKNKETNIAFYLGVILLAMITMTIWLRCYQRNCQSLWLSQTRSLFWHTIIQLSSPEIPAH